MPRYLPGVRTPPAAIARPRQRCYEARAGLKPSVLPCYGRRGAISVWPFLQHEDTKKKAIYSTLLAQPSRGDVGRHRWSLRARGALLDEGRAVQQRVDRVWVWVRSSSVV